MEGIGRILDGFFRISPGKSFFSFVMRKRRGEKRRGSMDLPSKIGVFSNGRPNASSSPYFRPVSRPGLAAGFARI